MSMRSSSSSMKKSTRSPVQKSGNTTVSSSTSKRALNSKTKDEDEIKRIENENPEIVNQDIQSLRAMKRKAIESYDFHKSDDIQNYIRLISKDNTSRVIQAFQNWLKESIIDCFAQYNRNVSDIEKDIENMKEKVKSEALTSYQQIEKRHIAEIEEITSNQMIDADRESNRCSPEVRELFIASKKLATADEVSQAKNLKEIAFDMQSSQIEERLQMVDSKYRNLMIQILKKHKSELEILNEKTQKMLETLENRKKEELKDQIKKVGVYLKFTQQKAIAEGSKQLVRKEMRSKVANDLAIYVKNFLISEKKEMFLAEMDAPTKIK
ncbi:hypothetical protein TRFO_03775 [Tritrichomonas foetus]|uniref:Uncharacterized protein n=1 Tax=Tritrichomonas foetus TaxID=1144522 RepID=A0A1J4KQR0_9EUKA|nr:hypothetical protein TRFO_03775 [Tritrichomonas foetus]|eukprot:OHT12132.1 hypothetical protein TRFO_03775 [Tritrichomonas foetus]